MDSNKITVAPPIDSPRERWLAFFAIVLGAFVAVLNNSLINVAIPQLTADLGSTTSRIQWVITGYTLASGIIVPITGFMEQRVGYKKFLIGALSVFTLGTTFCIFAWNDLSLITARIIAGLGGGVIIPLSMTIVYKIIPREQVGMAIGIWGISSMAAPAIGPTLSGYLIEWFNWRFLFIACVPVALFAILMVVLLIKEPPKGNSIKFDFTGFALAATCAGTLLYALSSGPSDGWGSFKIVSLFFIAFWSLIFLIFVESGKDNAVIDLSLFKNHKFTISVITSSFVMMGMYGGTFLAPLFLQNIQSVSPVDTGLVLLPQAVAMALMMPIAGKLLDKIGIIPIGLVGLTLTSFMTYHLHLLTPQTSRSWFEIVTVLRGVGIGLCLMPLSTIGMNAVANNKVGNASAASNLIRTLAGSMAIAILTFIMQNRTALHTQHISESITPEAAQALQSTLGSSWSSTISGLISLDAYSRGIADTFLLSSIPLFCSIPLILLFLTGRKASKAAVTENQA
ncbi:MULTISPECIES: DHA2 family efflux MFS transporter permease subunit [Paenibacillus]|uniref:DHA2 family efflux MFS transporter permease subunit n=1 Tax=Paenibacillus TaxID=44249 RepID=UPI000970092C|nr:DHA2 family efflux MFS transporter permease subunit [Paenibacillus peoriae]OMF70368.1 MFS transporter [Paenibacillus peoriae]OMF81297.1 MFS transporter [Paenibacillus peoriae]